MCVDHDVNVVIPRINTRSRWLVYKLWKCHFVLCFIYWETCAHDMLNWYTSLILILQHLQSESLAPTTNRKQQRVALCQQDSSLPKASSLTIDDIIPPPPSLGKNQLIQISVTIFVSASSSFLAFLWSLCYFIFGHCRTEGPCSNGYVWCSEES